MRHRLARITLLVLLLVGATLPAGAQLVPFSKPSASGSGSGVSAGAANDVQFSGGAGLFSADTGAFVYNPGTHTLTLTGCYSISGDVFYCRDAANVAALRNGTNAQTFRVYNTFTDTSNYERGGLRYSSNVLELFSESGGSGTARDIRIAPTTGVLTAVASIRPEAAGTRSLGSAALPFADLFAKKSIVVAEFDAGNSSTAITVDFANGAKQKVTMTGNATFTLSNPVAGTIYYLKLVEDGTGNRSATWPGSVLWSSGAAPTLSGPNKVDLVSLYYDGTSYFGTASTNY